jgi:hypothetical protein
MHSLLLNPCTAMCAPAAFCADAARAFWSVQVRSDVRSDVKESKS